MRATLSVVLVLCATAAVMAALSPEKGTSWKYPMLHYVGDGNEYYVRPESMCEGGGYVWIEWDRARDYVDFHVHYTGLPKHPGRRGKLCYEFDPSNEYNKWPMCVEHGKWRIILVHHINKFPVKYYYNATTGILLGSEYDYYGHDDITTGTLEVNGTGTIMLMTEHVRIGHGGVVDQVFRFKYSDMRNYLHKTGILDSKAYTQLGNSSTLINLYTHQHDMKKPLPIYSWSDILADMENGGGVHILFSYQPHPEPLDLQGRDNIMLGPGASFSLGPLTNGVYDTPTCWKLMHGLDDPHCGDVQVRNAFYYMCAP